MNDLLNRVKAAWKVLRGERTPPRLSSWAVTPSAGTTSSANCTVTWSTPPEGPR
jgi:hypothetical protein